MSQFNTYKKKFNCCYIICLDYTIGTVHNLVTSLFTWFVCNFLSFILDVANGKDSGKLSGRIVDSDMHDVGRFLNRILGLPPDIQNRSVVC